MTPNKNYLSQLSKTIQARNDLKNMYKTNQLSDLELYENVSKIQEPITKTLNETAHENKKELEKLRSTIEAQKATTQGTNPAINSSNVQHPSVLEPEDQEIIDTIHANPAETLTNNTLLETDTINNVKVYTIGSKKRTLLGLKDRILVHPETGEEYPIPTVGVAKLLFQSKPSEDDITKEDVDEYKRFLEHYHFNITQDSKIQIYHKFYPRSPTKLAGGSSSRISKIEPTDGSRTFAKDGDGIGCKNSNRIAKHPIFIPSDLNKLKEEFILHLADAQAGNKRSFNHANAIMKEMLLQKLLTSKEYRKILNIFFHV